jgi:hypothetical protein
MHNFLDLNSLNVLYIFDNYGKYSLLGTVVVMIVL